MLAFKSPAPTAVWARNAYAEELAVLCYGIPMFRYGDMHMRISSLRCVRKFAIGHKDAEDDIEGRSMVGVLGGFENVYERVYAREFGM